MELRFNLTRGTGLIMAGSSSHSLSCRIDSFSLLPISLLVRSQSASFTFMLQL